MSGLDSVENELSTVAIWSPRTGRPWAQATSANAYLLAEHLAYALPCLLWLISGGALSATSVRATLVRSGSVARAGCI